MPGNITSRNSFGTNFLIKGAGAKLVQQWQDVVSEFPPEVAAAILPPEAKRGAAAADAGRGEPAALSESERAVFKLIPADEPAHIDELAAGCGLPISELTGVLLGLEMREVVRQLPGRCYVRRL